MDKCANPTLIPKRTRKKTSYNKITNQSRQKLIEMVYMHSCPLKEAAKQLSINYSTAKTILRIFRIEKRVEKKNADEERVMKQLICDFKKDREGHTGLNTGLPTGITTRTSFALNQGAIKTMNNGLITGAAPNVAINNSSSSDNTTISISPPLNSINSLNMCVKDYCISPCMDAFNIHTDFSRTNLDFSLIEKKMVSIEDQNLRMQYFSSLINYFKSVVNSYQQQMKSNQVILTQLMGLAFSLNKDFSGKNSSMARGNFNSESNFNSNYRSDNSSIRNIANDYNIGLKY